MKNNIKKATVKFREDRLYFQHFMLFLACAPNQLFTTLRNLDVAGTFQAKQGGKFAPLINLREDDIGTYNTAVTYTASAIL